MGKVRAALFHTTCSIGHFHLHHSTHTLNLYSVWKLDLTLNKWRRRDTSQRLVEKQRIMGCSFKYSFLLNYAESSAAMYFCAVLRNFTWVFSFYAILHFTDTNIYFIYIFEHTKLMIILHSLMRHYRCNNVEQFKLSPPGWATALTHCVNMDALTLALVFHVVLFAPHDSSPAEGGAGEQSEASRSVTPSSGSSCKTNITAVLTFLQCFYLLIGYLYFSTGSDCI